MRQQLRREYTVQLDDRLHLWWWNNDDTDTAIAEWRHIPTDHDRAVDPTMIRSLLEQRDRARRRKEFAVADELLDQVVTAPSQPGLSVRVHDESRTWRLWMEASGSRRKQRQQSRYDERLSGGDHENNDSMAEIEDKDEAFARRQCLELVHAHNPNQIREVLRLLEKFPASSILPKLRERYDQA